MAVIGWTMFDAMDMRLIWGIAGTEALGVTIVKLTKKQGLFVAIRQILAGSSLSPRKQVERYLV